ncbi:hypothetical protein HDE_09675 [Halotydeus destructor]|nr:hypothetical protein HDE_09675 [Halotydeus destructor]
MKPIIRECFVSSLIFLHLLAVSHSEPDAVGRVKRWASPPNTQVSVAKLNALDVICGKDHMTVRAEFNGPFQGIVFSKGTYGQDSCVYIKPYSGVTHTTFKVYYDQCGTKPDLQGKYYENTIVIQYGTDIIEAWDEAKRLRCEWFEAYEKPATFRPAIPVADLDVVEMNFQGDDIDCWMEIQEGKGPWSREVSRIVPVGQPMTIVVSINDYNGQFDMRVKSCFAHDGVKQPIQLTDEYGCVLRPKMLSPFNKVRDNNGKATVISYSHFYAFKFPDTMNVQIQCTVEVCRHGCPDACQKGPYPAPVREITSKVAYGQEPSSVIQPRQPEEEPQPVYQEVAASKQHQTVRIPGIDDHQVSAHASQFLEAQGIDMHKIRAAVSMDKAAEESQNTFVHSLPHFDPASLATAHSPDNIGAELELIEDESKPAIKVVDIDIPADKMKPPTIAEQPTMFPKDLDQASKMLANLGLNMDLNSFAQGFISNMQDKEIQGLLQNDQLRQLAAASGVKFPVEMPQAQPLVNSSEPERNPEDQVTTTVRPQPVFESNEKPSSPLPVTRGPQMSTPGHFAQSQQQQAHQAHQQAHQAHHQAQQAHQQQQQQQHQQQVPQFQQQPPQQGHPGQGQGSPHMQHHVQHPGHQFVNHFANQAGIAQVMNIPMNPSLKHFPPQFNNFVPPPPPGGNYPQHGPHNPAKHNQRPLFFGGFSLPSLRLPSLFGGNSVEMRKDAVTASPVTGNPQPIPFGPRSLRTRRAAGGSEMSVHRKFQVVTAIDLAFSPNGTFDIPQAVDGRREEVVYGVCLPIMGLAASLSCALCVITGALAFSVAAIFKLQRYKAAASR